MKKLIKPIILFLTGGSIYICIEIIYRYIMHRTPTHWTMFVLGGLAFLIIGYINEYFDWTMPFWKQVAAGTAIAVALEFLFGCVLNILLGMKIWDYSTVPMNILGQVCLPFALIWSVLVSAAIILDDYLRYWIFGEDKPRYNWKIK